MTAIYTQYTDDLYREFGYSATWLPAARLEIGDVVSRSGERFEKVGSLADFGALRDHRGVRSASVLVSEVRLTADELDRFLRRDVTTAPPR